MEQVSYAEKVRKLHEEDPELTGTAIAKKLGINVGTACRHLRAAGVGNRLRRTGPRTRRRVAATPATVRRFSKPSITPEGAAGVVVSLGCDALDTALALIRIHRNGVRG